MSHPNVVGRGRGRRSRFRTRARSLAIVALAGWALALPAGSANLVKNGDFDNGLAGWTSDLAPLTWVADDGAPAGSAQLDGVTRAPRADSCMDASLWAYQCVDTLPVSGALYGFGAFLERVGYQATGNTLAIRLEWLSDPGCTGVVVGRSEVGGGYYENQVQGQWFPVRSTATAPTGVASILVSVGATAELVGGTSLRVDGVFLDQGLVFHDGFEIGDTSAWSAAGP